MAEKKSTVIHKGIEYTIVLDETGTVWFIDEIGAKTNIGQAKPVYSIDDAKRIALLMLESSGR